MGDIEEYMEDANLELEGEADVLTDAFFDGEEDVHEVGARVRRRGSRGPFRFRRFRIPASVLRRASGKSITRAKRSAYNAPNEQGAMSPLSVGSQVGSGTLTIEPQVEFQPLRCLVASNDAAAAPVDVTFRTKITDIKVGARTMLRAGGAATGLPATLFSQDYTGANPAKYDAIRPGTQFSITIAAAVGTDVTDVALVGRAG